MGGEVLEESTPRCLAKTFNWRCPLCGLLRRDRHCGPSISRQARCWTRRSCPRRLSGNPRRQTWRRWSDNLASQAQEKSRLLTTYAEQGRGKTSVYVSAKVDVPPEE
jgi:hypothetical protein